MKKIFRKIKSWISDKSRYWYVAYMYSHKDGKLAGCGCQYVTSHGELNLKTVCDNLSILKSMHNVIILNYKEIKKNQYVDCKNR